MQLTIGIPFYNGEDTLADAIRSVFAQTYQDWELILMDDGSSDGSLDIAMAVKDERVRVISDGRNKKLQVRLNQIVDEAKYELIARLDADDMMAPTKLERQLSFVDDPQAQIVCTGACIIDKDDQPTGRTHAMQFREYKPVDFFRSRTIVHPSLIARTQWFRENRYDPEALRAEDAELWCRAYCEGRLKVEMIRHIYEPLLYYRALGSLNKKNYRASYRLWKELIKKYGLRTLGYWGFAREYARKTLRYNLVKASISLGCNDFVARNRFALVEPDKMNGFMQQAQNEIQQIKATKVPGLD